MRSNLLTYSLRSAGACRCMAMSARRRALAIWATARSDHGKSVASLFRADPLTGCVYLKTLIWRKILCGGGSSLRQRRAPRLQRGGRGFKSLLLHTPVSRIRYFRRIVRKNPHTRGFWGSGGSREQGEFAVFVRNSTNLSGDDFRGPHLDPHVCVRFAITNRRTTAAGALNWPNTTNLSALIF